VGSILLEREALMQMTTGKRFASISRMSSECAAERHIQNNKLSHCCAPSAESCDRIELKCTPLVALQVGKGGVHKRTSSGPKQRQTTTLPLRLEILGAVLALGQ
jgi:hypothetical protein